MNAISLVHNAAALLGPGESSEWTKTIGKKNLSVEALEEKYSWMTNGKPSDEVERRLCGLFNLVMVAQVVDDWYDIEDDEKLGLHTIATEIKKEYPKQEREEKMESLTTEYMDKSKEFGVSGVAGWGVKNFIKSIKKVVRKYPRSIYGGRRERLLNGGEIILRKS